MRWSSARRTPPAASGTRWGAKRATLAWALAVASACSPRLETSSAPQAAAERSESARARAPAPTAAALEAPVDPLAAASLLAEVLVLTSPGMRGRGSATDDELRAAQHLAAELDRAGIEAPGAPPLRVQTFTLEGKASRNVLGVVRPPPGGASSDGSVVVLGAHYDHLGVVAGETYPGADDNASGTAAVLGVARALVARRAELGRPVVIAFFGAEEVGMLGSRAFVASGPTPRGAMFAMVNVDMIGRSLVDQPFAASALAALGIDADASVGVDGLRGRPAFERVVREACAAEGQRAVAIDDLPRPCGRRSRSCRGAGATTRPSKRPACRRCSSARRSRATTTAPRTRRTPWIRSSSRPARASWRGR
jgi:hypothetical protein